MSRLLPLALLAAACSAPDVSDFFTTIEFTVDEDGVATTDAFQRVADSAVDTLHVALPAGDDTVITEAILDAWVSGIEVEVVTDFDRQFDPGIAALIDAGVPLTLADDGISYFEFLLNQEVTWTSAQTLMSTPLIVADGARFATATRAGDLLEGPRLLMEGRGETLIEDLLTEHNQLFGGSDSVATTAYDSPAKSIAHTGWIWPLPEGDNIQLFVGPQQRVTKRVIDATYGAHSNVWVLTDDYANEGLSFAMQEKALAGFDMRVVVGSRFGTATPALSELLLDEAPDVPVSLVPTGRLPTMVFVDTEPDANGRQWPARVFVLTHDLYSAGRLYNDRPVITDQFADGLLWVVDDHDHGSATVDDLLELFKGLEANALDLR